MELDKSKKILVIVESPNKRSTIGGILKKAGYTNATVAASIGHIIKLEDDKKSWKNSGIWPEDNFKLNLKISKDKTEVVKNLKSLAASADYIFLASDSDREGYVISWSLLNFLKLDPNKCYRMIMHEITPKAVVHALENPVPFDDNIVDAGLARMTIDKLIGWGLSPVAKNYIGAKSVGRCQSAGLLLIAERENEIRNFKAKTYYDLYLNFIKNKNTFRAKYIGTDKNPVEHLDSKEAVTKVVNECINDFIIKDVSQKIKSESPKPPFSTPTFQQEAASKLNLSVKAAQSCAQKLFEGVSINGTHVGLVTYIRTDSTDMAPEFIPDLKAYIEGTYGKNSFVTPRVGKKGANDQEGHEALRCTDPTMTPEQVANYLKDDLLVKVYKLIWQRTIASAMPEAKISETTYIIENNGHLFNLVSNEVVDPGYRVVYSYKDDDSDEEELLKESFKVKEKLKNCELEGVEKSTKPKPRYKEATFIKELQKRNIGRPSTYATIVETVLSESRGYCKLENKEIIPTERGMQLAAFLSRAFPNLINFNYTVEMEESLDKIANGQEKKIDFLNDFFKNLEDSINNNKEVAPTNTDKKCPQCGATLVTRRNKWGNLFLACPNYPNCKYAESIK